MMELVVQLSFPDFEMDNIGENEALLRSSKDFQKLGDGKKK